MANGSLTIYYLKKLAQIVTGRNGNTILHLVVRTNKCNIAQFLIDCGADINRENDLQYTPFDYALSNEMRKLLLDNGAIVPWYQKLTCFF